MQLPRGTFYGIQKDRSLPSLLAEAAQSRFTGSIIVSSRNGRSSLVIQQGQAILAEYRDLAGNSALQQMQQQSGDLVEAEFTSLNEVQLKLALEFNKPYLVPPSPGSTVLFAKKDPVPSEIGKRPLFAAKPSASHTPRITDPGDLDSIVNGDLEALDRIDLEKIAGKMRITAMRIASKLELDHLANRES